MRAFDAIVEALDDAPNPVTDLVDCYSSNNNQ